MGEVFGSTPNTSHLIVGRLADAEAFTTLDGSTIRELAGAVSLDTENQSLAEATVPPGGDTEAHYHRLSEEIYFFTAGSGRMKLGDEESEVNAGDCVVIPPGTEHKLWNTGREPLVLLCCCAPAYSHEDTVVTGR
jgi:mannose-6-phosphate isomerase-like protein (cupin superfamily)